MLKKSLLFLLLFALSFLFIDFVNAAPTKAVWDTSIMESLIDSSKNTVINNNSNDGLTVLQSISVWIKNSLTGFVLMISVWAFLFVWIRLAVARWNPEEFKKAMSQFVYAIVWIFLVSIAWASVTLVAWLNL